MRAHLTQDETDQLRALLSQEGVRRAVGWAKERISTERWPAARRLLIQESAPGRADVCRALVALRAWPEASETVFQEAVEVALDGSDNGLAWARQIQRIMPWCAGTAAMKTDWLLQHVWPERDRIAQQEAWAWLVRALWQPWIKGEPLISHERLGHEQYVLGAGVVSQAGARCLRKPRWLMRRLSERIQALGEPQIYTDKRWGEVLGTFRAELLQDHLVRAGRRKRILNTQETRRF